jgi:hypothetical protein
MKVRQLTGALVIAGMVAGALVVSVAPAAAEPSAPHEGSLKACSAIRTAASTLEMSNRPAADILWAIYARFCV